VEEPRRVSEDAPPARGKSLAMIFQKASTRTRVSFEVAMSRLGGHALFLSPRTRRSAGGADPDTARVLSRYADAVMIRTFATKRRWSSLRPRPSR